MFFMKIKYNILLKFINYIYINKILIFVLWLIYIVLKFLFIGINFFNL